jgi:TonB family protein
VEEIMLRQIWAIVAAVLLAVCALGADQKPAVEKEGNPRQLEKGMTAPVLIEKTTPAYPEDAKKEKIQGSVKLDALIGTGGEVTEVKAVESPDPRLSAAAIDAVKQWKFTPAKDKQGKPIQCKSSVTVNFKLK